MIAVDETPTSNHAFEYCFKLFQSADQVHLVYITDMDSFVPSSVSKPDYSTFVESNKMMMENATKVLAPYVQRLEAAHIECNTLIVPEGKPEEMICREVEKYGVDFLVVGSRGRGSIQR